MKKRSGRSHLLPAMTSYARHFFIIAFISLGIISFFTIKPFLSAIILGGVAAYTFFPAYRVILKYLNHRKVSALILSTLLVLAIVIPIFMTANNLVTQTSSVYNHVRTQLRSDDPLGLNCNENIKGVICAFTNKFNSFLKDPDVRIYVTEFINAISEFVSNIAKSALLSLPILATSALVALFTMFYLFLEGDVFAERMKKLIPLGIHYKNQLYAQINDVLYSVIYGSIVLLLIHGASGALVFWLVGTKTPIFLGVMMALLALLPLVGTWIIWLPLGLSFIGAGNIAGDPIMVWKGIAVLAYGVFFSIPLDIVARPFIMGSHTRVHPMIILLGVLGGLAVFGVVGVFIGPVILALLSEFLKIYEQERMIHKED